MASDEQGCRGCPHLLRESTDFGMNGYCCHPQAISDGVWPNKVARFIGHATVLEQRPHDCPLVAVEKLEQPHAHG